LNPSRRSSPEVGWGAEDAPSATPPRAPSHDRELVYAKSSTSRRS
jgi:hypothetical protein